MTMKLRLLRKESQKSKKNRLKRGGFSLFQSKNVGFCAIYTKIDRPSTYVPGGIRQNNQFQQFFLPIFCATLPLDFSRKCAIILSKR